MIEDTSPPEATPGRHPEGSTAQPSGRRSGGRARGILVGIVGVFAVLGVILSGTAYWVHQTVFDTGRYVALVGPIVDDPAVQDAIAAKTSEQLFEALDVEARVEAALAELPPAALALKEPLVEGAQGFVTDQVRAVVASDRFREFWIQLNTAAHEKIVALLRGDYEQLPNVVIDSGEVRLNLIPVFREVLVRLAQGAADLFGLDVTVPELPANDEPVALQRLAAYLGRPLPEDFGQVALMSQDTLEQAQGVVDLIDRLVWGIILVTVALIVLTVVLARNRRRALIWLGAGTVVGLLLIRVITNRLNDQLIQGVTEPNARAAARAVIGATLANARSVTTLILIGGVVAAVAAYLAGRPRWLQAGLAWFGRITAPGVGGSQLERWVNRHYDLIRIGGALVAVVALLLVDLSWGSFFVIAALLGLYLGGVAVLANRARAAAQEAERLSRSGGEPHPAGPTPSPS